MALNDQLFQQSARHGVYVQRFGGFIANAFDPYILRLKRDIRAIMSTQPETIKNLTVINKLVNEIRRAQLVVYGDYNNDVLFSELNNFAVSESKWEAKSLSAVIESDSIKVVIPKANSLWASVINEPLIFPDSNKVQLLKPFTRDLELNEINRVGNFIRTGFITGKSNAQIVNDIVQRGGVLDKITRSNIGSMVRTSTNHTSNIAREKTQRNNKDIVIGYKIISVLDGRTSNYCKGVDGLEVKWSDKKQPRPSFHINCRTSTVSLLDGRYDINDDSNNKKRSFSSYYEWLKDQGNQGKKGREFVVDVLGIERAKLFLDGGLSTDKFKKLTLDEQFQPISLKELEKKQSLALSFDKITD